MAGVDEVLDVAAPGVIGVMAWVTLRRRVRETRTGEAVCASLQSRHPVSAAALPVTNISVDGAICLALIDSGCLRSDGHCVCALDAHTLLPEMALRRDVTDR